MDEEKKLLKTYLTSQNNKLNSLITTIQTFFNDADKDEIASDWLKTIIDKLNFPEKHDVITESQ